MVGEHHDRLARRGDLDRSGDQTLARHLRGHRRGRVERARRQPDTDPAHVGARHPTSRSTRASRPVGEPVDTWARPHAARHRTPRERARGRRRCRCADRRRPPVRRPARAAPGRCPTACRGCANRAPVRQRCHRAPRGTPTCARRQGRRAGARPAAACGDCRRRWSRRPRHRSLRRPGRRPSRSSPPTRRCRPAGWRPPGQPDRPHRRVGTPRWANPPRPTSWIVVDQPAAITRTAPLTCRPRSPTKADLGARAEQRRLVGRFVPQHGRRSYRADAIHPATPTGTRTSSRRRSPPIPPAPGPRRVAARQVSAVSSPRR